MTKSAKSNIPSFAGNPKYSHTLLLAPIGGKSSVFLANSANSAISTYPELLQLRLIITAESTQTHMFLLCACAQKKHVVIDSKRVNYRDHDSEFLSQLSLSTNINLDTPWTSFVDRYHLSVV